MENRVLIWTLRRGSSMKKPVSMTKKGTSQRVKALMARHWLNHELPGMTCPWAMRESDEWHMTTAAQATMRIMSRV